MPEREYLNWSLDQQYLLPPSLHDWLPENHAVYRFLELVNQLDISEITKRDQEKDPRGRRSYHPRMMLALLMWSYCQGIYSSRRIEKATYEQIPFRVLTGNQQPHFTVINEFRGSNLEAFSGLFLQVLLLCSKLGMVKLGHISLDGTKVKANASKHKAMSHKRMRQEIARYEREIRALVTRAEEEDRQEDDEGCLGPTEDELPDELRRREQRLARIKQLKAELEADARHGRAAELRERAQELRQRAATEDDETEKKRKLTRARRHEEKASNLDDDNDNNDGTGCENDADLPQHRVATTKTGEPTDKAQRNFVDPDSRIMKLNGEYVQGYNAQILVDGEHQVIIAQAVTNQAPDQQHLIPMLDRAKAVFGALSGPFSADAGYIADYNVEYCEAEGIDAYISTRRDKHGSNQDGADEHRQQATDQLDPLQRMAEKMRLPEAKKIYARRKVIPEPVFGQIKEPRGFRRFSLRGTRKVRCEWVLVSLCHNLLKILSMQGAIAPANSLSGSRNNSILNHLATILTAFLDRMRTRIRRRMCRIGPLQILQDPRLALVGQFGTGS